MKQAPLCGDGLSPRGRGKRGNARPYPAAMRSIPAWAGETPRDSRGVSRRAVYPRVGGGNRRILTSLSPRAGLSPRGRGKHAPPRVRARAPGSIPAWAGETRSSSASALSRSVYPRVGGGNLFYAGAPFGYGGLSPRGRGKRGRTNRKDNRYGSIPAWAGETIALLSPAAYSAVYPRVGGGNSAVSDMYAGRGGLSPRGRGKPSPPRPANTLSRSIPAWAGETAEGEAKASE